MKKAISPLISIVLLVGFTVALIAIIATWSSNLVGEQKGFAETQQEKFKLSDLNIKILEITQGGGAGPGTEITLTFSNDNDYTLAGFLIRAQKEDGTVIGIKEFLEPISPYETKTASISVSETPEILELVLLAGQDGSIAIPYPNKIRVPS